MNIMNQMALCTIEHNEVAVMDIQRKDRCRSPFATAVNLLFYNVIGIDPFKAQIENEQPAVGLMQSLQHLLPNRESTLRARRHWSKRLEERERSNIAQLNLSINSQMRWSA